LTIDPAARAPHCGDRRARHLEDALGVGADDRVPIGVGRLLDGLLDLDAGVVDQDPKGAEGLLRRRRRAASHWLGSATSVRRQSTTSGKSVGRSPRPQVMTRAPAAR
jgi:hypothetical protein